MPTLPTIHINGTSRDALVDAFCDADTALRRALDALAATGPNARDYYPQGNEAFGRAVDEHRARLAKLHSVRADVLEIVDALARV